MKKCVLDDCFLLLPELLIGKSGNTENKVTNYVRPLSSLKIEFPPHVLFVQYFAP